MPIFHVYFDLFFDMYFFVIEIPCKDVKVWAERHNFLVYRKTSIKEQIMDSKHIPKSSLHFFFFYI